VLDQSGNRGVVTLELHVTHTSGIDLRDRVLWDTRASSPTPEAFARQLCADLAIPELEGAVAFAVREQLTAKLTGDPIAETAAASGESKPTGPLAVVRSEREALAWSPVVSLSGDSSERLKLDDKDVEQ